ncbi:unnamed protein product, partial [Brassica rapa subsp. trilocularis]
ETFIIDQDTIQPFWVIDFGLSITAQQLIFLISSLPRRSNIILYESCCLC